MIGNIIYYVSPTGSKPISDFIVKLQEKQRVKTFRLFKLIREYGLSAVGNHLNKLRGTSLWEIRILGQDNIRFLYFVVVKDTILILNGFIKKDEKTPLGEITLANKRYVDWVARQNDH